MSRFIPGDVVHRKLGKAPIIVVVDVGYGSVGVVYATRYAIASREVERVPRTNLVKYDRRSDIPEGYRSRMNPELSELMFDHFPATIANRVAAFCASDQPTSQETPMSTKLYQTVAEPTRFFTKLATDSSGRYVLEEKGTNVVVVLPATDVVEVRPYTVGLKSLAGTASTTHVLVRKGSVTINDVLFLTAGPVGLYRVAALDTGEASAQPLKRASKVQMVHLEDMVIDDEAPHVDEDVDRE